jgi:hypothetical protein
MHRRECDLHRDSPCESAHGSRPREAAHRCWGFFPIGSPYWELDVRGGLVTSKKSKALAINSAGTISCLTTVVLLATREKARTPFSINAPSDTTGVNSISSSLSLSGETKSNLSAVDSEAKRDSSVLASNTNGRICHRP